MSNVVPVSKVQVMPDGGLLVDGRSVPHQGLVLTYDIDSGREGWLLEVRTPLVDLMGSVTDPVLLYVLALGDGHADVVEGRGSTPQQALRALADALDQRA